MFPREIGVRVWSGLI